MAGTGYCVDGADGGLATETPIQSPFDVATIGSDIYFSDDSCRVRKVSEGIITTVAGTGVCEAGPDSGPATSVNLVPTAIEFDGAGNLYIGDVCRVRKLSGGMLSTIAGTGTCGDSGDGGPATGVELVVLGGLAFDGNGDLYISDRYNCRVRRVSNGVISAFAGNGTCGYGGDGGPATAASLIWPGALEIDATGNVYIADSVSCRVRKVSSGNITTIAGTGCPSGTSGDGGPATSAGLNMISGLAFDASGDLHLAQEDNCRIRKISDGIISTVAGIGYCSYYGEGVSAAAAALDHPRGIGVDSSGAVIVADMSNCRLRKVDGGVITTIAGHASETHRYCLADGDGGPAASAGVFFPVGLAVGPGDEIYFGEQCQVRRISGGVINRVAGTGPFDCGFGGAGGAATAAKLEYVRNVAVDANGDFYINDYSCRVRRVSGGNIETVAGTGVCGHSGDGGLATDAQLETVRGIAIGPGGDLYVSEGAPSCRIRKVASGIITTIAGNGSCLNAGYGGPALDASIWAGRLAVDPAGNVYFSSRCVVRVISEGMIDRVAGVEGECGTDGDGGPALGAKISYPGHIAFNAAGDLYVAEYQGLRVRVIYGVGGPPPVTPTNTPTPEPTNTPTPEPTITPTPTKQPDPGDTDGDGCSDQRESGPDETLGGQRDYKNPHDFYDVLGGGGGPPDRVIDLPNDILGVMQHFAPSGAPPYDVAFDRGPSSGPNPWNMTAPDGVIDLPNDISGVIQQFGHSCQ